MTAWLIIFLPLMSCLHLGSRVTFVHGDADEFEIEYTNICSGLYILLQCPPVLCVTHPITH